MRDILNIVLPNIRESAAYPMWLFPFNALFNRKSLTRMSSNQHHNKKSCYHATQCTIFLTLPISHIYAHRYKTKQLCNYTIIHSALNSVSAERLVGLWTWCTLQPCRARDKSIPSLLVLLSGYCCWWWTSWNEETKKPYCLKRRGFWFRTTLFLFIHRFPLFALAVATEDPTSVLFTSAARCRRHSMIVVCTALMYVSSGRSGDSSCVGTRQITKPRAKSRKRSCCS